MITMQPRCLMKVMMVGNEPVVVAQTAAYWKEDGVIIFNMTERSAVRADRHHLPFTLFADEMKAFLLREERIFCSSLEGKTNFFWIENKE